MPLCLQLVRKLPSKEKDEWVRQVEREQFPENVKGLAEWAQVRAKHCVYASAIMNRQYFMSDRGAGETMRKP